MKVGVKELGTFVTSPWGSKEVLQERGKLFRLEATLDYGKLNSFPSRPRMKTPSTDTGD